MAPRPKLPVTLRLFPGRKTRGCVKGAAAQGEKKKKKEEGKGGDKGGEGGKLDGFGFNADDGWNEPRHSATARTWLKFK